MSSDAVGTAVRLVRDRFPAARAAWLGGSAAAGSMTATSDLDITVLLASGSASFRESLLVADQPVELFVHTEASLNFFCAEERRRRRPTLLRLIGSSIVIVDTDGAGARVQAEFDRLDKQGPAPLTTEEIQTARYLVTDLLGDLKAGGSEALSVAATLWRETAELLLGAHGRWSGTGKWLLRELRALDAECGTGHADGLLTGLAAVGAGDTTFMLGAVIEALAAVGGPLFGGYRRTGTSSRGQTPAPTPLTAERSASPATGPDSAAEPDDIVYRTALQHLLSQTVVTPFSMRDLGELVVLQRCCWVQEALANNTLEVPALHESAQDVLDWATSWTTLVVRCQDRLVAAVRARTVGSDWEIGRLMVAPDLAGRGLGSGLLGLCESLAPASATRFVLFTGASSTRNIRTYHRAGYRLSAPPTANTPGHIAGAVYMTKAVPNGGPR